MSKATCIKQKKRTRLGLPGPIRCRGRENKTPLRLERGICSACPYAAPLLVLF